MSDPGTWTLNHGLSQQEPVCTTKKIKQPQQHGFLLSPKRDGGKWSVRCDPGVWNCRKCEHPRQCCEWVGLPRAWAQWTRSWASLELRLSRGPQGDMQNEWQAVPQRLVLLKSLARLASLGHGAKTAKRMTTVFSSPWNTGPVSPPFIVP